MRRFFLFFALMFSLSFSALPTQLFSEIISTFYGPIDVQDAVILELIQSEPVQRLKKVRQYGVSYYSSSFTEEYSRYDHSLGVFTILKLKKRSLKEQISGLLHDVSHTVFSHVGDYIFQEKDPQKTYHDSIHGWFLERYKIRRILEKYGYAVSEILPEEFLSIEQPLPNLSADRLDYNLQGAYHQGFLTKKEILEIIKDLYFDGEIWVATNAALIKKLALSSLFMTEHCWGSAENVVSSLWLSQAIKLAYEQKSISSEDIYFGTDDLIWKKLSSLKDPKIQALLNKTVHPSEHFQFSNKKKANFTASVKFRGLNPWIKYKNGIVRLTNIDVEMATKYYETKKRIENGWQLKLSSP